MRMYLKRKNKKRKIFIAILLIFLAIILSFIVINYYSKKSYPIIKNYAEAEVKKLSILIINKSITKQIYNIDTNNLFNVTYNKDGEIVLIDFNTKNTTKILSSITSSIELNLRAIEEGKIDMLELPENSLNEYDMDLLSKKIICEIPFGIITNSNLLANIGPKIPIKLSLVGNVSTGFSSEVVEYGINNAMIKLLINIELNTNIILPITTEEYKIKMSVPIAVKIVQGKIPNYYLNGFTTNSNIRQ